MYEVSSIRITLPDDVSLDEASMKEGTKQSPSQPVVCARLNSLGHIRRAAPFILSHEVARGVMYACQAALGYTLMLAVM